MKLNKTQKMKLAESQGVDFKDLDLSDFLILSDKDADLAVKEYIKEMIWAFRPNFLANVTGLSESTFQAIQSNNKCEDNTDAVLELVELTCGFDKLVEEAIKQDTRGHFLSSYDGNEIELGNDLYAYKIN